MGFFICFAAWQQLSHGLVPTRRLLTTAPWHIKDIYSTLEIEKQNKAKKCQEPSWKIHEWLKALYLCSLFLTSCRNLCLLLVRFRFRRKRKFPSVPLKCIQKNTDDNEGLVLVSFVLKAISGQKNIKKDQIWISVLRNYFFLSLIGFSLEHKTLVATSNPHGFKRKVPKWSQRLRLQQRWRITEVGKKNSKGSKK